MGWYSRRYEAALSALQAENTDLRQLLRELQAQHSAERQLLLDRIMALTAPGGLREVKRAPSATSAAPEAADPTGSKPRTFIHPGGHLKSHPPFPSRPPQLPGSLTDNAVRDVVNNG